MQEDRRTEFGSLERKHPNTVHRQFPGRGSRGYTTLEDSYFALIHRAIDEQLDEREELVSLNLSMSGADLIRLLPELEGNGRFFDPHIVVIILSRSEGVSVFDKNMRQAVAFCESLGVRPIFVRGARSFEYTHDLSLGQNLSALNQVAREFHFPVLNLNEYLRREEIYTSGFVWWDANHLSD